jgi:hypothetical protein
VEALLEGEAEGLTRKAVEMALGGDVTALRLCLDRIAPPRRDRPITFDLGELAGPADALVAVVSLIRAVSAGEIAPSEATAVMGLLDVYRRGFETTELEARLAALEAQTA